MTTPHAYQPPHQLKKPYGILGTLIAIAATVLPLTITRLIPSTTDIPTTIIGIIITLVASSGIAVGLIWWWRNVTISPRKRQYPYGRIDIVIPFVTVTLWLLSYFIEYMMARYEEQHSATRASITMASLYDVQWTTPLVLFTIVIAVLIPIHHALWIYGVGYKATRTYLSVWPSILLLGIPYSIAMSLISSHPTDIILTLGLSTIACLSYEVTRNVYPSIIIHITTAVLTVFIPPETIEAMYNHSLHTPLFICLGLASFMGIIYLYSLTTEFGRRQAHNLQQPSRIKKRREKRRKNQ